FDLMFSLDATEEQLDFPTVYGSAKAGWMGPDWQTPTNDVVYLLDQILEHIPPATHKDGTVQMRITSLDYSSYTGRIAVGKVTRGELVPGSPVTLVKRDGSHVKSVAKECYLFEGLGKEKTKKPVPSGEICAVLGLEGFDIGDTIADAEEPEGLTPIQVDEPTMSMLFVANNSPFFGKDGKYVTSRQVRDRLFKETEKNLALRVEETDSADSFLVYGRGILHLSILVETMRREGYEIQLGQPNVIIKEINGKRCEPIEALTVQVPDEFSGKVIELVTARKGEIANIEVKDDRAHLEFYVPARGLIGLRNQMLTATEGEAIMAHRLKGYEPWKGELGMKRNGALISLETGTAIAYSIDKMQDRGRFFVEPGEDVYAGQVIGENTRMDDLTLNIIRTKKLTNMRAAGADDKTAIAPAIKFSLEEAMEYIRNDEYIEVTTNFMRIRKIYLDEHERKRRAKALAE
ncbi:MAG: translational GTPase TypA, partial [Draconibacterium sp.]|nr:translational GTPase TypA [Draconibacterium sp.]